jgi:hypothetical protein
MTALLLGPLPFAALPGCGSADQGGDLPTSTEAVNTVDDVLRVAPWDGEVVRRLRIVPEETIRYDWQGQALVLPAVCPNDQHHCTLPNAGSWGPLSESLAQALQKADVRNEFPRVELVTSGYDATLTFTVDAEAVGASYVEFGPGAGGQGGGFMYTGAEVHGTVSLSAEGHETLTWSLDGRLEPQEYASADQVAPYNAPFISVVRSDLEEALAGWFEPATLDLDRASIPTQADWTPDDLQWED